MLQSSAYYHMSQLKLRFELSINHMEARKWYVIVADGQIHLRGSRAEPL